MPADTSERVCVFATFHEFELALCTREPQVWGPDIRTYTRTHTRRQPDDLGEGIRTIHDEPTHYFKWKVSVGFCVVAQPQHQFRSFKDSLLMLQIMCWWAYPSALPLYAQTQNLVASEEQMAK